MKNIVLIIIFIICSFSAVYAQPVVNLGNDTTFCAGNTVTLNASNAGAAFLWSTGATTQTIVASSSGVYWVDVTNAGTTRDSIVINVIIPTSFTVADTTVCTGQRTLTVQQQSAGNLYWWSAMTGGNLLNIGNSYNVNIAAPTTYYIEGRSNVGNFNAGLPNNTAAAMTGYTYSAGFYANNSYGLVFSTTQSISLDSVTIFTSGNSSFTVELRNSANVLLTSRSVSVTGAAGHRIGLNFLIDPGTGYRLLINGFSGAGAHVFYDISPNVFPRTAECVSITAGFPVGGYYSFFYNWRVTKLACTTARQTMNVSVVQAPVVNFPTDTVFCGTTLNLAATNVGATYLWSTGATTDVVSITQSGIVTVAADNGACTARDTVNVQLIPTTQFTATDTTICTGQRTLSVQQQSAGNLYWWSALTGGSLLNMGSSYNVNIAAPATYYIEGRSNVGNFNVGLPNNTAAAMTGYTYSDGFYANNGNGLVFSTTQSISLDSVTIFTNGNSSFTVELRNSANVLLASRSVSVTGAAGHRIGLNFLIDPGTGYRLLINGFSGVGAHVFYDISPNVFPRTTDCVSITAGFPTAVYYSFFYNWRITKFACTTARQTMNVSVVQAPVINFPTDTVFCGSTLNLAATNVGATYLWSTGATTAVVSITQSSIVTVAADNGACTARDTVNVQLIPTTQFTATDTTVCTGQRTLSVQQQSAGNLYWWSALTGGNLLNMGSSYNVNITAPATYYIEGRSNVGNFNAGLPNNTAAAMTGYTYLDGFFPNNGNGLVFSTTQSISLDSVTIFTNGNSSFTVELRNSANVLLASRSVSVTGSAGHRIGLNFLIDPGTGYRLLISGFSGVGAHVFYNISPNVFPRTNDCVSITAGFPTAAYYSFFYNWRITKFACTTARQTMNVSVIQAPVINFPSDTLFCGTTLNLSATNVGATYLWSTGATTDAISITQNGIVSVVASNGACSAGDTVNVSLLNTTQFAVSDTSVCSGLVTFNVQQQSAGNLYWWSAPTGGTLLSTGTSYTQNVSTSSTYYIEGRSNASNFNAALPNNTAAAMTGYTYLDGFFPNNGNGLVFSTTQSISLDSVTVYTNGNSSFTVELRNSSNTLLASRSVSVTGAAGHRIGLNFLVDPGTGYRLLISGFSGVGAHVFYNISPNVFPRTSDCVSITAGFPTAAYYSFFYNWRISKLACATTRQPMNVTVIPTPQINLPSDTIGCFGNMLLDVTSFSGATYLWSNGATTSNIQLLPASTRDTMTVLVQIGICSDRDTFSYIVLDSAIFQGYDTTVCGGQLQLPISNPLGNNGLVYWWNNASAGSLLAVSNTLSTEIYDTTTYYVEVRPVDLNHGEGLASNLVLGTTLAGYYPFSGDYGNFFDIRNDIYLDSVTIYIDNAPMTATFQLINSGGTVIYSKPVVLLPGTNQIPVETFLPVGNNYRMLLKNLSGAGKIFCDAPMTFPLSYQNITIKNGVPFAGNYYFYNWRIRRPACPAARRAVNVNILPTRNIGWPSDTIICAGSINLDVSYPNSTYLWNDGQTVPAITVSSIDTVWAEVTTGTCVVRDTIFVYLSTPPTQLIVQNDTTICGGQLTLNASGNADTYAWYTQATGGVPFVYGQNANINVSDTASFYVEGFSLLRNANIFGHSAVPITNGTYSNIGTSNYRSRGLLFDVYNTLRIDEISIFSDGPLNAHISLRDDLGYEIQGQNIQINAAGEHVINLNWVLQPGNDYSIWIDSIQGSGKLYVISNYGFPLVYPDLRIRAGLPAALGTQYNTFYKWRISTPSCPTARQIVRVYVPESPIITMPADTAICNGSSVEIASTLVNTNYQYNWNTGATTNNITALTSGLYTVTVTNAGSCPLQKNIQVQFPVTPSSLSVADSSICSPQTLELLQNPSGGIIVWSDISGVQTQYISAPYPVWVADTSTFNISVAARASTRLGQQAHPAPSDAAQYESFILSNTFNVLEPTVLDSVAVYFENAPTSFDIVLSDSANNVLARRTVQLNQAQQKVFVALNFVIMPGNRYQLMFENTGSNRFLVNRFVGYPQTSSAGIAVLTGTNFSGVSYNCFYDWHFSYALNTCYAASNDLFTVNVTLPVQLPDSIFTCTDITLDASTAAASSYIWSTGATSPSILADISGLFAVTVSDGLACSYTTATFVQTPAPILLSASGVICGTALSTNYTTANAANFLWSTGDTSASISLTGPGLYAVSITSNEGCLLSGTTTISQIETPPVVNLGNVLDICNDAILDAGFAGQGMSYLWNTGETTQTIAVAVTDTYAVTVTSANNCAGSDFVYVREVPAPVADFNYFISNNAVSFSNTSIDESSVLWFFGDSITTTLQNPFHLYANTGCYIVSLVAMNSCASDTLTIALALGVDSVTCLLPSTTIALDNDLSWNVFPNPNSGQFQIEIGSNQSGDAEITLYATDGQRLKQENHFLQNGTNMLNLNWDDLVPGLYLLRLKTEKTILSKRLVILRN